jgi:hypothetical protein
MNNINFKIALVGCMLIGLISCNSDKKEDLKEANADLKDAAVELKDSVIGSGKAFKEYITNTETVLAENDRLIDELKGKVKDSKSAIKAQYIKDVAVLEAKNAALKLKIAEAKESTNDKWDDFEADVNKEMDELGKAISKKAEENMAN